MEHITFDHPTPFETGSQRFGFRVAWIKRAAAAAAPEEGPAGFYRLLRGRAERLGYPADFRIEILSDLAPFVASLGG